MRPLIIAHRGDSAHRPENTIASFVSALEAGATIVELDVQLTRDGQLVVIHDDSVDRTTNGRGKVSELTLAEIRSLSAGYPARFGSEWTGERVPQLAEALGLLRGRAKVLVEIKPESVSAESDDGVEARTLVELQRTAMTEDAALLSFESRALERCRRLAPEITRGHLFYRADADAAVAATRAVGAALMLPEKGMLDDAVVSKARAAGLELATWVIDEPEELARLAPYELYGVATNRPGVLIEALEAGALGSPERPAPESDSRG